MKRARDETTKKLVGEELDDAIIDVVSNGNVSGLRELLETYDDVTRENSHSVGMPFISQLRRDMLMLRSY